MKSRKYTSVFIGSLIISLILVALGFVPGYGEIAENWRSLIGTDFGWFYLLLVTLIVFVWSSMVQLNRFRTLLAKPRMLNPGHSKQWRTLFNLPSSIGVFTLGLCTVLSLWLWHILDSVKKKSIFSR